MNTSNQIVRQVVLDAPLERVWHAIADADAFGTWDAQTGLIAKYLQRHAD